MKTAEDKNENASNKGKEKDLKKVLEDLIEENKSRIDGIKKIMNDMEKRLKKENK